MKKIWLRILLICILILFGWRVFVKIKSGASKGENGKNRNSAVVVEVGSIKNMTVSDIGEFSGSITSRSLFNVSPKVSGRLENLSVDIGSVVKNGQIVAHIDSGVYEQDLDQAKAQLAISQAQAKEAESALKVSDHDLATQRALFEKGFISQTEIDNIENQNISYRAKRDVALATVQKSQAAVRSAQIQLEYTKIRVNWTDGGKTRVVGERFVDPGAMLTSNTPIISVLDNSMMTVQIDIVERDYPKIKLGQETTITCDAYPDKKFIGRIARIAPELNADSRQARVEIDIPNSEGLLKPGMYARVFIQFQKHENVPVVPVAALCNNKGVQGVYLIDKNTMKVHFIPLKTGIQQGDFVEILSPQIQGDVVTLGQDLLEDGKTIKLPKAEGGKPHNRRAGA
ncbi:MAG TPA: efflux RND transporter periplasmic adaptor subunit [Candidatus Cloacimonadota bacterium]|nr:efflux RND transporter periplasmic adaptor subunit [Candidatus Cloacimonadota bacterium]HPT71875.1 efflux RND transporter periplasmic adaptor subunit [Candidatus Cloacimonadota bacterium]